jgi:tetratricopeptide (TPR) repeat protein
MSFGELCIKENRLEEGLDHLRQAADLSPENSGIRWRLFNLYQKQGQYPEALKYFLEVIGIDPENEELKYKLADFYRKNHHYEEALEIFKTLAAKHSRLPRPRYLMASLLHDMGQLEEAQNQLDKAQNQLIDAQKQLIGALLQWEKVRERCRLAEETGRRLKEFICQEEEARDPLNKSSTE